MPTFLAKTEPSEFSFADVVKERVSAWTGVKNPAALIALRSMRKGDDVLIYHTADERAIVGLATVARAAYEDPDHPGLTPDGLPKFAVVDLKAVKRAPTPLSLAEMKANKAFASFELLRQSRLSVMPVPPEIDAAIRRITGLQR